MKQYADKHSLERHFVRGDYVLVRQSKKHKLSTAYEPAFYVIVGVQGSSIRARRIQDNKEIFRDASHFKLANTVVDRASVEHTHPTAHLEHNQEEYINRDQLRTTSEASKKRNTNQEQEKTDQPTLSEEAEEEEKITTPQRPESEPQVEVQEQASQPPRRSGRIRKPVEKMNL